MKKFGTSFSWSRMILDHSFTAPFRIDRHFLECLYYTQVVLKIVKYWCCYTIQFLVLFIKIFSYYCSMDNKCQETQNLLAEANNKTQEKINECIRWLFCFDLFWVSLVFLEIIMKLLNLKKSFPFSYLFFMHTLSSM